MFSGMLLIGLSICIGKIKHKAWDPWLSVLLKHLTCWGVGSTKENVSLNSHSWLVTKLALLIPSPPLGGVHSFLVFSAISYLGSEAFWPVIFAISWNIKWAIGPLRPEGKILLPLSWLNFRCHHWDKYGTQTPTFRVWASSFIKCNIYVLNSIDTLVILFCGSLKC